MGDWWNPIDSLDSVMDVPGDILGGLGMGDALGNITGSRKAAKDQADAMDRAIKAREAGARQAAGYAGDARSRGLASLQGQQDRFMSAWNQLSPADLDAYYAQQWGDVQRDVNASAGKTGTHDSGAWRNAMMRGRTNLSAQQSMQKQQFMMDRLRALMQGDQGGAMANLEMNSGAQMANIYTGQASAMSDLHQRQGQQQAQADMAGWQNLMQIAPLVLMGYGMAGGGAGAAMAGGGLMAANGGMGGSARMGNGTMNFGSPSYTEIYGKGY